MLRITKTTPGVLDLSQVRDEHGTPVTLNGPSTCDVPDAELDNPILQRVRDMRWVTVERLPAVDETAEPDQTFDPPPLTDHEVVDTPSGEAVTEPGGETNSAGGDADKSEPDQPLPATQSQLPTRAGKRARDKA